MTNLTPEQRTLGRENANRALGVTRRDLLKAAAAAPALAGFYFGYKEMGDKPAGQGRDHRHRQRRLPGDDPRPQPRLPRLHRLLRHPPVAAGAGGQGVLRTTSSTPRPTSRSSRSTTNKEEMLDDPDVEMVVIALPLWLHAPVAIEAMKAGKHVFSEKLMAHSVAECKEMCRVARETNRLLAVGHQRHYSVLYDNANYLSRTACSATSATSGPSGTATTPSPLVAKDKDGNTDLRPQDGPARVRHGREGEHRLPAIAGSSRIPEHDKNVDYAKYGYKSLDELVRWRLYNRTGAGLMAELGSHQLDACSIFLGKKHPLAVTGIGGTFFYKDGREVDDHVFVIFEFPRATDDKDRVVVTYSSINTNAFDGYGEMVMGSRGTMIVEPGEGDPALQGGGQRRHLAADEHHGRDAWARSRCSRPARAWPARRAAVGAGQPGHGRPLARLPRGARALRLLHPPRQRLELPRRQGAPAPLPRRGRPGRRRHRPDQQPRHAAEPADRVRPRVVRLHVARGPRRHPGHREARMNRRRCG